MSFPLLTAPARYGTIAEIKCRLARKPHEVAFGSRGSSLRGPMPHRSSISNNVDLLRRNELLLQLFERASHDDHRVGVIGNHDIAPGVIFRATVSRKSRDALCDGHGPSVGHEQF